MFASTAASTASFEDTSSSAFALLSAAGSVTAGFAKFAGRRPRSHLPSQRSETALAAVRPIALLAPLG
eukprot:9669248-Heterocapsa_arctica.AAC.1